MSFFFKFDPFVFVEIAYDDSFEHWLTTSEVKPMEKNTGTQTGSKIRDFAIFSLYSLDIAQDCSFRQCLTMSKMMFYILMLLSVHSNLLFCNYFCLMFNICNIFVNIFYIKLFIIHH